MVSQVWMDQNNNDNEKPIASIQQKQLGSMTLSAERIWQGKLQNVIILMEHCYWTSSIECIISVAQKDQIILTFKIVCHEIESDVE